MKDIFIEQLLHAQHCSKGFSDGKSLNTDNNQLLFNAVVSAFKSKEATGTGHRRNDAPLSCRTRTHTQGPDSGLKTSLCQAAMISTGKGPLLIELIHCWRLE